MHFDSVKTLAFMQRNISQLFCTPLITVLVYFGLNFFSNCEFGIGGKYKLKIKFELSLVQSMSLLSLKLVYTLKTVYIVVFICEEIAVMSFRDFRLIHQFLDSFPSVRKNLNIDIFFLIPHIFLTFSVGLVGRK